MKVRRWPSSSPLACSPNLSRNERPAATPRLISSAYIWSASSMATFVTHGRPATATRMSSAIRKAKWAAHQWVGNRNPICTAPAASTSTWVTKPNPVTDSSSSGSVTDASRSHTSAIRVDGRSGWMGDRRRPLRLRWSWGSSCPDRSRFPNTSQQLLLRLDIDAVQPCRVEPEDFFLRRQRQLHAGFLADGFRQFEGDEFLDQPLGRPDAVVAAVEYLVLADPEQQLRDHMREVFRTRVNERQHDRQATVDVRLLGGDPAKIVQTRQATVLDDKVQILKVGRRVVDIGNVES